MKRFGGVLVVAGFILIFAMFASPQCPSTLDKTKSSGVLIIGAALIRRLSLSLTIRMRELVFQLNLLV